MEQTIALAQSGIWRQVNKNLVRLSFLIGIILLPFSTHLMGQVLVAGVMLAFISREWRQKWPVTSAQRTTFWVVIFFGMIFLGVFYSGGTFKSTLNGFFRCSKVLYFIAFFPFMIQKSVRDFILNAFIVSVLVSIVVIVGKFVDEPLVNAIDSSFLVGVCNFFVLRKFFDNNQWRWMYGILFIVISSYLLLYNIERTGYVMFFGGLATFFWQCYRWKGMVAGALLMSSLIGGLYAFSPTFQLRINLAAQEAQRYITNEHKGSVIAARWAPAVVAETQDEHQVLGHAVIGSLFESYQAKQGLLDLRKWFLFPHADIKDSSIGLRLGFVQYSWREIKKHPWIGNGTGSFIDVYRAGGGPGLGEFLLPHPHNEYISVWFQLGLVGLALFLILQWVIWFESFKLPKPEQYMLQGLLVCFALLGFCNASLTVNPSGNLFILMTTLFLASKIQERKYL